VREPDANKLMAPTEEGRGHHAQLHEPSRQENIVHAGGPEFEFEPPEPPIACRFQASSVSGRGLESRASSLMIVTVEPLTGKTVDDSVSTGESAASQPCLSCLSVATLKSVSAGSDVNGTERSLPTTGSIPIQS